MIPSPTTTTTSPSRTGHVEQSGQGDVGVVAEDRDLGRVELGHPEHELRVGRVDRVVVLMRVAAEDQLAFVIAGGRAGLDNPTDALGSRT